MFEINVANPAQIETAAQYVSRTLESSAEPEEVKGILTLNNTHTDAEFIEAHRTDLCMVTGADKKTHYSFVTNLYFAQSELLTERHGFYNRERLKRLATLFAIQGRYSRVASDPLARMSYMVIEGENNKGVVIDFGPESWEADGALRRNLFEALKSSRPDLARNFLAHTINQAQKPRVNEKLVLQAVDLRHPEEVSPYNFTLDTDPIETGITTFAKDYQDILHTLYKERGIEQPDKVISLGI